MLAGRGRGTCATATTGRSENEATRVGNKGWFVCTCLLWPASVFDLLGANRVHSPTEW